MSNVAELPILADRYTPCVRTIHLIGLDMTGVDMRAQVRLRGDTPGAPLADLRTVTNGNAEGLRLTGVIVTDGIPTSTVELVINETTMKSLPYAGEIGDATPLAWDWQGTIANRKRRIARGSFEISGDGVTGADTAPSARVIGFGRPAITGGMRSGAQLTFGDEVVQIRIDGPDLAAPFANEAKDARDAAAGYQEGASLAAATAQAASRYFPSRAAGEAASSVDQLFTTDDGGDLVAYRRTSGGSVEIARTINPANLAAPNGPSRVGWGLRSLDKSLPMTLAFLAGVDPFTTADQTDKIQYAFDVANAEEYQDIQAHPDAIYRKDGQLLITNSFDGRGCVFRALSDGPQAINVYEINGHTVAPGMRLKNFTTLGAATVRTSSPGDNGLTIGQEGVPSISDIVLEAIRVGSVDGDRSRGHAAAGISVANASRVWIYSPLVENCLADGIHFIHGAQDGYVYGAIVDNSGDDAASVVSYRRYGALCNNILFDRLLAVNGRSRGCAVVGGRNVRYRDPTIRGSAGAAVYIYSEASFDTYGCDNVRVTGLTAEGCVVGGGAAGGDPNFQNAVVMMGGRAGSDTINGAPFDRSVRDCHVDGIIRQTGSRAAQGAEYDNPFVIRPRVDLDMENVPLNIPGVLFGGEDGELRFRGRDLGGVPLVQGASARGRHVVHHVKVDRARLANPAADTNILLTNAPDITELRIEDAEFNQSSTRAYNTDAGFDLKKLRTRGIKVNGVEATGTDFKQGAPTFASGWGGNGLLLAKRADGFVALDGSVTGGATADGTLIMQLPAGYWPRTTRRHMAPNGGGAATIIEVRANGGVIIVTGGADNISLNLEFAA